MFHNAFSTPCGNMNLLTLQLSYLLCFESPTDITTRAVYQTVLSICRSYETQHNAQKKDFIRRPKQNGGGDRPDAY